MTVYRLGDRMPVLPPQGRYWIAPTASVMGDVTLGDEASVWFNAVIRGDNDPITIGARSNIQDGSVLHSDRGAPLTLGDDVTVGHMAMIHSCEVGNGSLLGIGAIILAHAKIGANTIVGAGTLIPEGKAFGDGVLIVGSPGRVVRDLTAEEIARLKASADHYVDNWRYYARDLIEL